MVKFNACKLLSLRMMAILLLFLNGCASIGSIQPEKESLQELSIRIPEIGAFIKSQKTYQELSPDAQSAYIDSKARIEIAKLFLNDKRFSSEQITMIVMQQRTLSDIKKTIRTDETIAPQIRDSAVAEINAVQTAYDIQIPKEIVMIYVFLQKPGVFTDGSSEYIEVVNKNEFIAPLPEYIATAKKTNRKLVITAATAGQQKWLQNRIVYKGNYLTPTTYFHPGLHEKYEGAEIPL